MKERIRTAAAYGFLIIALIAFWTAMLAIVNRGQIGFGAATIGFALTAMFAGFNFLKEELE